MLYGAKKYEMINQNLNHQLATKKCLISVHRGTRGGNVIENTLQAYQLAYSLGADMVELDLAKSTDDRLYCFHDTTEAYNLQINQNIQTLSSTEIDQLFYYNSIGVKTRKHVDPFEKVLKAFTHSELYNIDRAWDKLPYLLPLLDQFPHALYQALLKSPVKKEVLDVLEHHPVKYMYMPIIYSLKDFELLRQYDQINVVGAELIMRNKESEFLKEQVIENIRKKGLFIWFNAITLGDDDKWVLSDRMDDEHSICQQEGQGWIQLLQHGADIIQTDWPYLLKQYRDHFFNK